MADNRPQQNAAFPPVWVIFNQSYSATIVLKNNWAIFGNDTLLLRPISYDESLQYEAEDLDLRFADTVEKM